MTRDKQKALGAILTIGGLGILYKFWGSKSSKEEIAQTSGTNDGIYAALGAGVAIYGLQLIFKKG